MVGQYMVCSWREGCMEAGSRLNGDRLTEVWEQDENRMEGERWGIKTEAEISYLEVGVVVIGMLGFPHLHGHNRLLHELTRSQG